MRTYINDLDKAHLSIYLELMGLKAVPNESLKLADKIIVLFPDTKLKNNKNSNDNEVGKNLTVLQRGFLLITAIGRKIRVARTKKR